MNTDIDSLDGQEKIFQVYMQNRVLLAPDGELYTIIPTTPASWYLDTLRDESWCHFGTPPQVHTPMYSFRNIMTGEIRRLCPADLQLWDTINPTDGPKSPETRKQATEQLLTWYKLWGTPTQKRRALEGLGQTRKATKRDLEQRNSTDEQ